MPPAFLLGTLDEAGYQLSQVFNGWPEDKREFRLVPTMMSAQQTLEHLCEVYTAFMTMANGGQHEWGSYQSGISDYQALHDHLFALRDQAVQYVKGTNDEKLYALACEFIVLHDGYHVGQLVGTRIHLQPDFDPYCIYRHSG